MSQKLAISRGTIIIAIIATMMVVLPIVVGLLAAEMYSDELLAAGVNTQLTILLGALVVLVIINVYTLRRTVGRGRR